MTLASRINESLKLRACYRRTFDKSDHAQTVLRHLMRVGCVTSPVSSDEDKGAQRLVLSILNAVHGNDEALKRAIEEAHKNEHDKSPFA